MSGQIHRLAEGGSIDRSRPLRFRFNGRDYGGFEGDSLASALLANGVGPVGRSFKYHRPRGIQGAGTEDAAAVVQLCGDDDAPNALATRVQLREGLEARSVNCWPGPDFDLASLLQAVSGLITAGFAYKTFMWPHWRRYEPAIRRAAGLGRAPATPSADLVYESRYDHCDLLVAGAGPAGLMAALAAARSGARVVLADDGPRPGGRLLAERDRVGGAAGADWAAALAAELDSHPNVLRLQDATVWGYHEGNFLTIVERRPDKKEIHQRNRKLWAKQVVLATGAIERPIVFPDNDRPGVMLASAARAYVNGFAVRPGRRAVVFTNNDDAYRTAFDLQDAGIEVRAVVDLRAAPPAALAARARAAGIELLPGHVVHGVQGRARVKGVDARPRQGGGSRPLACDLVCVSGGWNPAVHLFSQSRGRLRYDPGPGAFLPDSPAQPTLVAGSAAGAFGLAACLAQGAEAGAAAATAAGFRAMPPVAPETLRDPEAGIEPFWAVEDGGRGRKAFVDMLGDVTLADIRQALREGYGSIEHVKRYTTAGMGFDQGKTGNVNVIGIVAEALGRAPGEVGTTTFRPPYTPVEFGAIAGGRPGPHILPSRRTPMTGWHEAAGAVMYEAGARWRRPGYYPRPGQPPGQHPREDMEAAVLREARAVREAVGIYDGSPLGKIEIKGPDAIRLLNLVTTNAWDRLEEGRGRYGLMLTDDGLLFDDGVTFRLARDRYLMTGSTGHADRVVAHLEPLVNGERPGLKVLLTPVTSQWANATVCGPLAREVLAGAGTDIALSRADFPFMAMREGTLADLPARIFRVSYTGELSYEINTPARHGLALWKRLMAAGAEFGIRPVGSEANHLLRVEKGFLSLAHEADGTADPFDLGMAWLVSKRKRDFIGKRALEIRRADGTPRLELVGLLAADPELVVPEGAPLTPGGRRTDSEGFVSAAVQSVARGRPVALALLRNGRARIGETVHAVVPAEASGDRALRQARGEEGAETGPGRNLRQARGEEGAETGPGRTLRQAQGEEGADPNLMLSLSKHAPRQEAAKSSKSRDTPDRVIPAVVTAPVFYDPEGLRPRM